MAFNLKPLGSRVVVEPIEQEDVTAGGIVLPETAKEKPQKGKVLSVGAGDRDDKGNRIAMDVKAGDTVLFAKYAGTEIKVDGKKLLILRESDLLAIVEVITNIRSSSNMAAKQLVFGEEARRKLKDRRGRCRQRCGNHPRPQRPQCGSGSQIRFPHHHP